MPDPGTPIRLLVRNGPIQNQVTLATDAWQKAIALDPGEERVTDVPLEPGRSSALLRMAAVGGMEAIGCRPDE